MADVKWIKITTDIFNDEKMMLIEYMPDSDSLIVIWFKLLALAGKTNNGGLVMISDKVPYTEEMLAVIFRRKQTVVKLALDTFESFGMIERVDNKILISNWEKHQNVKGLESIREQRKLRQQKFRDNQKILLLENKKEDKELDIDIESHVMRNVTETVTIPYKEIIDYLNKKLGTKYKSSSAKNQSLIKARINEGYDINDFKTVIDKKYNEWNKTEMATYLRPETLFSNKFEGYLNQVDSKPNRQDIKDIKDDYITYIPDEEANNGPFKVGKN